MLGGIHTVRTPGEGKEENGESVRGGVGAKAYTYTLVSGVAAAAADGEHCYSIEDDSRAAVVRKVHCSRIGTVV